MFFRISAVVARDGDGGGGGDSDAAQHNTTQEETLPLGAADLIDTSVGAAAADQRNNQQ